MFVQILRKLWIEGCIFVLVSVCLFKVFASMLLLVLYVVVRDTQTLGHPCLRGQCGCVDGTTRRHYTGYISGGWN